MATALYYFSRGDLVKEVPPDAAKPLLHVADQLPESVMIGHNGKQVTLSVKSPQGWETLGPILAQLALSGGKPAPRPPEEPPR